MFLLSLVPFLFLDAHYNIIHITFLFFHSEEYSARGYVLFLYAMLLELSYVCMPTFIATIANMDQLFA